MRIFQPGEGPSRGLLHDYTNSNFAKVLFKIYWFHARTRSGETSAAGGQPSCISACQDRPGEFWSNHLNPASVRTPQRRNTPQTLSPQAHLRSQWKVLFKHWRMSQIKRKQHRHFGYPWIHWTVSSGHLWSYIYTWCRLISICILLMYLNIHSLFR